MNDKIVMPGIFISSGMPDSKFMDELNKATYEWEMRTARGECYWICSSCCTGFPEGMPDTCPHNAKGCDEILQSVKSEAAKEQQT